MDEKIQLWAGLCLLCIQHADFHDIAIALSGAPDPPVIRETNVLSAHHVLINWNTTTGQIVSNFSVELSLDFVTWKKAVCNGSVVPGDCVITQKEAVIIQLKPYTNYTFRVMARGLFETSNYSTESKMVLTNQAGVYNTGSS